MDLELEHFHATSVFQDQTRLDYETFWTQSCVCEHNFSDKNNVEIQEEKTFTSSYMIDVCIEKAITPKPANYKLPSPKQRWKKYVGSKVHSDYTEGLYVLT